MASNHMNPDHFALAIMNSAERALKKGDIVLPLTLDQTKEIASILVQHGSPDLAGIAHTLAVLLVAKGEDPSSSFIRSLMSKQPHVLGPRFDDLMQVITTTDEYNACSTEPSPTCPEPAWGEPNIIDIPEDEY